MTCSTAYYYLSNNSMFNGKRYTYKGTTMSKVILLPNEKRDFSKRKELAPQGSFLFFFLFE